MLRVTAAGHDDAQTACEHVWALKGIHLRLGGEPQFEDECELCGTIRLRVDEGHPQARAE